MKRSQAITLLVHLVYMIIAMKQKRELMKGNERTMRDYERTMKEL